MSGGDGGDAGGAFGDDGRFGGAAWGAGRHIRLRDTFLGWTMGGSCGLWTGASSASCGWLTTPASVLPPLSPGTAGGRVHYGVAGGVAGGAQGAGEGAVAGAVGGGGAGQFVRGRGRCFWRVSGRGRPASGLTGDEVARLRRGIVECITAGFAVYDRAREGSWPEPPGPMTTWSHPRDGKTPCPQCGGAMAGTRIRARATWYCPGCQV